MLHEAVTLLIDEFVAQSIPVPDGSPSLAQIIANATKYHAGIEADATEIVFKIAKHTAVAEYFRFIFCNK